MLRVALHTEEGNGGYKGPGSRQFGQKVTFLLLCLSLGIRAGGWLCPVPQKGLTPLAFPVSPSLCLLLPSGLGRAVEMGLILPKGFANGPDTSREAQLRASMEWEMGLVFTSQNPLRA